MPTHPLPLEVRLRRAHRLTAVLAGTCLALLAVLLFLARPPTAGEGRLAEAAFDDPETRRAAVDLLASRSRGIWDAHPDPDVGRVMIANHTDEYAGVEVRSNRFGMREASYRIPKPEGTLRVVFLGDSYVYGYGIESRERMGVHFRRYLLERAGVQPRRIECLHLAVSSWNIVAECAFVRRQLRDLRPDLVFHFAVSNDLDDVHGVRGFGVLSSFTTRARQHADTWISATSADRRWGVRLRTPLQLGLDHVSRERYAEAAARIGELAAALEESGARYVVLLKWWPPSAGAMLTTGLRPDQIAYLSPEFSSDRRMWVSETDSHWNLLAQQRVARLCYGLALQRDLLPGLGLEPWPEAEAEVEAIHGEGVRQAASGTIRAKMVAGLELSSELDFSAGDTGPAEQVYGGIDRTGRVSPMAALVLDGAGCSAIEITGEGLPRPDLGGVAELFVEEFRVGEIALGHPAPFTLRWPLPPELEGRRYLGVRIVADDYAYVQEKDLRCVAFVLKRIRVY